MYYEPPKLQIVRALNSANPELSPPLSPESVTLGTPRVNVGDYEHNTRVTLTVADDHSYFSGSIDLDYNRWDLDDLLGGLSVPGVIGQYGSSHETLAALLEQYQLPLTPADIVNQPIPVDSNQLVFEATDQSLAVIGSITLRYRG